MLSPLLPPPGGSSRLATLECLGALRSNTEGLRLAPRAAFPCPAGISFGQGGPAEKLVFHAGALFPFAPLRGMRIG
ncbi:hypothetical protein CBW56_02645 [Denitratisoma oestradiolicum]|nr:hypothetical protein CBW56_02645 [Denitratisoma oestradiolicum]